MNIDELSRYGIDPDLIDVWRAAGHERLLPIQQAAVQRYNLFGGENLLVSAPTSSGKTFIGEMAAARQLLDHHKCFYLVPLKALAAEKFETFRERYSPLGARVVVSTRDCRRFDEGIVRGDFQMAVVVYEKMQQLLTQSPDALQDVRLVVADELQMLGDARRGGGIEMLLTRLKLSPADFQFVGLSAVLRNSQVLSRWLGARFLEYCGRPVELRQGILYRGSLEYETYNTHERGTEAFLPLEDDRPAWQIMLANAVSLASRGEQSLMFLPDKRSTRRMAKRTAQLYQGPSASEAIEELEALEDTRSRRTLFESLRSGVAFHNADMSLEERRTVERHFRGGAIRIVCATPTLALGVNLPAKNVFIEPMLWDRGPLSRRPHRRRLTKAEYENMSGRAGRLSLHDDFGRSILVATTELERIQYENCYLAAALEDLEPQPKEANLDTHIMNLVASGAARSEGEVARFVRRSLTGLVQAREIRRHADVLHRKIAASVCRCVESGLVSASNGSLEATSLGRLCAVKGISAPTGRELSGWLASLQGRAFPEAEALYIMCRTEEARDQHFNMSTEEYRAWVYPERLTTLLPWRAKEFLSPVIESRNHQTYEEVKAMKMALVLHAWVEGRPAIEIEDEFHSLWGTIRGAAEVCAWLADATAAIATLLDLPGERARFLEELSARLAAGVPGAGLPLCGLRVQAFSRTHIMKLLGAGIEDPDALCGASPSTLRRLLGAKTAARIQRALQADHHESDQAEDEWTPWNAETGEDAKEENAAPAPEEPSEPPPAEEPSDAGPDLDGGPVFRRDGEKWEVSYDGRTVYLNDLVGMHYIARLLRRPGEAYPAWQLRADVAGAAVSRPASAGEMLDSKARDEYGQRLRELREELAEAEAHNDPGRQETIQRELDALAEQLSKATGLKGRSRRASDDSERARKAVSMAIARALGGIKEAHPTLWQHLQRSIQRGRLLCYAPDGPVAWTT
jgi:helicase